MKKITLTLFVVYALILSTACPSKPAIRRAAEANYQLAGSIVKAQIALEEIYDAGIITTETAQKLNSQLRIAGEGSKRLTAAVKLIQANAAEHGQITQSKLDALNLILSDEIITPVLQILDGLKILDARRAPALFAALATVKTLILIIGSAFPQKSAALENLQRREVIYA